MKESVLSVLVYLFQNYFLTEPDTVHDRDSLQSELIDAGFDALHIGKAFDWLAELQAGALALEQSPVDLGDLKWVVLLVLYNSPDGEAGYAWMASELLGLPATRN